MADNRRRFAASGLTQRMYVAEDATTGDVLGYGAIEQDPADFASRVQFVVDTAATPARFRLHLLLPAPSLDAGVAEALLQRLGRDAAELGGQTLWYRLYAHEAAELQRLLANGFLETSRVTEWHRAVGTTVGTPASVAVTTLAEERPMAQMLAFWNAVARPASASRLFSMADIEERIGAPHVVPDGYFIARLGGSMAGALVGRAARAGAPGRRVISMHVLRSAAGQGVEQALVARADGYAKTHGVTALETHTAAAPYSIPTPYDALGFTPFVEMVVLEKPLPAPVHL